MYSTHSNKTTQWTMKLHTTQKSAANEHINPYPANVENMVSS